MAGQEGVARGCGFHLLIAPPGFAERGIKQHASGERVSAGGGKERDQG